MQSFVLRVCARGAVNARLCAAVCAANAQPQIIEHCTQIKVGLGQMKMHTAGRPRAPGVLWTSHGTTGMSARSALISPSLAPFHLFDIFAILMIV